MKELKEIFSNLTSNRTPNYSLDGQVLTIDNKDSNSYIELWDVNLFAIDIDDDIKGDFIMSLGDGEGNAIYYRLLGRVH